MPSGTIHPTRLFLDAGNTRIKAAIHVNGKWQAAGSFTWDETARSEAFTDLCRDFNTIILVSVKRRFHAADLKKMIRSEVIEIDRQTLPPHKLRYRTPETLGMDRYLACLGAWSFTNGDHCGSDDDRNTDADHPDTAHSVHRAVIVSDAGTACTIDAMDAEGVYYGGVIMPGLHTLIDALGKGADGLFAVAPAIPESWPPDSTTAALQAGTAGTFLAAWESHVMRMQHRFPDARIWLTGGETGFLKNHTSLDCETHEFLVFQGMLHWLESG